MQVLWIYDNPCSCFTNYIINNKYFMFSAYVLKLFNIHTTSNSFLLQLF